MSVISSKDVYQIIRKTLGIINNKIMNHGEITGYILYKMMEYENTYTEQNYTEQELVDYTMLGILHDIGLYKEDNVKKVADFETKNLWPHSIYGFLFLKYLSPIGDRAEIVLYHHLDYNRYGGSASEGGKAGAGLFFKVPKHQIFRRGDGSFPESGEMLRDYGKSRERQVS